MGSVKVRENPQVTASVWLFRHLVPVGLKTWPTLLRSCQRLSIVPRKDNQLFTLCCVLLCAKYCSFPHIFSRYFYTLFLLVTSIAIVPVLLYKLLLRCIKQSIYMKKSDTAQSAVIKPIRHFNLVKLI